MQSNQDAQFGRLARLAALATGADWAAIRLADADTTTLAASVGAVKAPPDLTREALAADRLIVRDSQDGDYAAAPILGGDGARLGIVEAGGSAFRPSPGLEEVAALAAAMLADRADASRASREADHRIKNIFASVQALVQHSARRAGSVDSLLKTFNGRLRAMASAQDLLIASRSRGATLAEIAKGELGALAPGQIRWQGPEIALSTRAAQALSLAIHELAANAQQHGALTTDSGRVELIWQHRPDGGFAVEWLETGGPLARTPEHRGFGLTMIETAAPREMDGVARLEFAPGGLRAHLEAGPSARATSGAMEPVSAVVQAGQPAVLSTPQSVRGLKVLVVEDSVLLALELQAGLSSAGADVVATAAEVEQAIALLDKPIDAVVLDANLNGRSAQPVAQALLARGIPFVVATGYADTIEPLGFNAPVVRKPYNINQIIAALGQLPPRGEGAAAA